MVYLFPVPQLKAKTGEINSGIISKCCPKPAEMPYVYVDFDSIAAGRPAYLGLNCCVSDMQKA